ncbi:SDR family NAD(P)-dependent oxidoreductase [Marinicellulosiphila megalodicopiae]|uniref:SDR family NAD(P)-dependent oxidoreductase n=1 Tax=Marinicellulosiphila megalodicopiae TaxID=2724896 RepID=UPI003BAED42D
MNESGWALVTGGCMRVGAYINEYLAARGKNLVLHFNQSSQPALALQKKLESTYSIKTVLWQQDLSKCHKITESIETLLKQIDYIDLLINNASMFEVGSIQTSSLDLIQNNLSVHLTAPWLLTQSIAKQNKAAQVINILDANLSHRYTSKAAYFISKKALETLTELSAIELAPHIRVNGIAPGYVLPPNQASESIKKSDMNLMHTPIALDQFTNTIEYLQKNSSMTGQIIHLDGGSHLSCPPYMLKN